MPYLVGVDTGGTFTDFALYDTDTHLFTLYKCPSTPDDPSDGLIKGLRELLSQESAFPDTVTGLAHGTTVATNALIQDRLGDVGMITTAGFRDILELARQRRPHTYDLDVQKPRPPAPRRLRLEVRERMDAWGRVELPLDETDLAKAAAILKEAGVPAVAVCFLHSYRNPTHERRARTLLRRLLPGVPVTISSDVLLEFREYERFATTALNAALLPVMRRYLGRVESRVRRLGIPARPRVSNSFGSTVSIRTARESPIASIYSGPSAGVVGATAVAEAAGLGDLITLDMGGTSTDVCLVRDGSPLVSRERETAGWPVATPSFDVHSIGAGGGSVLWADGGGYLQVGPHSAGAVPGPACYGLGGHAATLTDANVVAGRLSPASSLANRLKVDGELAWCAMKKDVAGPLGLSLERAVEGTLMVLTSNLVRAVRSVSVERGYDPRDFTLVAYGGAGPMHAPHLAAEMGITSILVPESPGVLCALGLMMAGIRAEFSQSQPMTVDGDGSPSLCRIVERTFVRLERRAARWLKAEDADSSTAMTQRVVEVSYLGQGFQVPVQVDGTIAWPADLRRVTDRFHKMYEERYGYALPGEPVRLVHFRLRVSAAGAAVTLRESPPGDGGPERACIGVREAYMGPDAGVTQSAVYRRTDLRSDDRIEGPAIVEQMDSTTVVLPDHEAHVDRYRNMIISV